VISGLVMPHHDLARPAIIQALDKFPKNTKYEVIVVLSPNHFRPESTTFTSSVKLFDFKIDRELVGKMVEGVQSVIVDEKLVEGDHGVVTPMTYLKEYWPEAKFVPVLVSPFYTPEKLAEMAKWLSENTPKNTLFVASVDFAHENQFTKAMANNQESIEAISSFDFKKLQTFDDNHMDSPAAMATLLYLMQERKTTKWETWESLHGAELLDNPEAQGTSYVVGTFR
jgi:AmmeMemoRadiSam system protein B